MPQYSLRRAKHIRNALNQIPVLGWFLQQVSIKTLIKCVLIFGFFGYIPYVFSAIVFSFTFIALIKRDAIANWLVIKEQRLVNRLETHGLGALIGNYINRYPKRVLKSCLYFVIFFFTPFPYNLLALYGFNRMNFQDWERKAKRVAGVTFEFLKGFIHGVFYETNILHKYIFFLTISIGTALFSMYASMPLFLGGVLFLLQSFAGIIGGWALVLDVCEWSKKPIESCLRFTGLFVGAHFGNWLTYKVFRGKLSGTLGPARGVVQSSSIISSISNALFGYSPVSSLFRYNTSLARAFLLNPIQWIYNSIFFTYDMRMVGNFYGKIGPTNFQVMFFMLVFAGIGQYLDKLLDYIPKQIYRDLKPSLGTSMGPSGQIVQAIATQRWTLIGFATLSSWGLAMGMHLPLVAFAGQSVISAGILLVSGLAFSGLLLSILINAGTQYFSSKGRDPSDRQAINFVLDKDLPDPPTPKSSYLFLFPHQNRKKPLKLRFPVKGPVSSTGPSTRASHTRHPS